MNQLTAPLPLLTPLDILGSDGSIARRLDRYELRLEQLDMAEAVHAAFAERRHLAVEAGTGVGKSFAYLVPSILQTAGEQDDAPVSLPPSHNDDEDPFFGEFPARSRDPNEQLQEAARSQEDPPESDAPRPPRAVISTHTISLQEQLIEKDVPFLRSVLPFEFTAILVKGRGNYLCLRRLESVYRKQATLLDDRKQRELERLRNWSRTSEDGSRSDLNPEPDRELWPEICCETGNCLGRKCKFYPKCFYAKARRRIDNAQILVVNHALLFSDLAIRIHGGSILPTYDMLVFDEAHTMEQVAASHLGLSVSQGQVEYNLNRLYNPRTQKGLLMERDNVPQDVAVAALQAVDDCFYRAETFFDDLSTWLRKHPGGNGRVREPGIVSNGLSEGLRKLAERLRDVIEKIKNPDERQEYRTARDRILALKEEVELWCGQGLEDDSVYWIESFMTARGRSRVEICASPIDIGPILREHLFEKIPSVVMTSATLSTGHNPQDRRDPFTFFKSQIGLTDLKTMTLGSPFDYRRQATLVVRQDAPSPDVPESVLRPFYADMLRRYLDETDGGAFVLFTSYKLLKQSAADLTSWLAERSMPLLTQGEGMPRGEMLRRFKESGRGVLFGTDSFWQGVDVPGQALRNVIITKLPFLVPSQPVIEAKIELIRQRGGNPFAEYQLPQAILKFKQGFGRLIRTREDRGLVVVLDPRIHTKSYGRQFLAALPECHIRRDWND